MGAIDLSSLYYMPKWLTLACHMVRLNACCSKSSVRSSLLEKRKKSYLYITLHCVSIIKMASQRNNL